MSGNCGSGKTHRILEFLQLKDVICSEKFHKVYYFYSVWQTIYEEMKVQSLVDHFIEGVSDNETIMELIETQSSSKHSEVPNHQLLIYDDVFTKLVVRKDSILPNPFTVLGHHKNLSIILVNQMFLSFK